ncbi:hypothetical protein SO694_00027120 [Aureococcus anophagefferens]|jgi:hypothetical protein|uniref:Nuclear transcription factor Y subunit n=2 Tax=Aureococcus anophagefferens TaxID=44056 RepID=A0ABR1FUV0_AURAN|nr:hypothetical protein JL720_7547 [Aureococcus anophagefferens]
MSLVTYWSRRQFIHEETDEHVTKLHATPADLYPPTFYMTRKQAQRIRMRDMSDDERHRHFGARKHKHQYSKPAGGIRRDTAVRKTARDAQAPRSSNTMEVLEHKEAPPAEPKRRTRRSRRADKKSLEQQGNWIEVTQAGCTFWVNDTTGIADEDPPPIRKPDGTFEPRKHTVDADADAEEVLDDESVASTQSFAFLDDWSKEGKHKKW